MKTTFRLWVSAVIVTCAACATALAGPFAAGNLALVRVGDGTVALSSAATVTFIDEYTPAGGYVQTIIIPATGTPVLTLSGTATSEGALMLSPGGGLLCFGGYQAVSGTANVPGTTSLAVPREVGTVNASGTFAVAATTSTHYNTGNIRSGATDDANNYWGGGNGNPSATSGGVYYFGNASPASLVLGGNLRWVNICNGELYFSSGSATAPAPGIGVHKFTGKPVGAATSTPLFIETGTPSPSPYGFAINPSGTVMYVADDRAISAGGGIQRWNKGASWTLAYTLGTGSGSTVGARGLVVDWSGTYPVIYATTAETPSNNRLIKVTDAGAGSIPTTLKTVGANMAFRGVAFGPGPSGPVELPANKHFFKAKLLPPPAGVYVSPQQWHAYFQNGIIISNVAHRIFTGGVLPPTPGVPVSHTFGSQVEMEVSSGGGTWVPYVASGNMTVEAEHLAYDGDTQIISNKVQTFAIVDGPPGLMIRESPTLTSGGQTTVKPVPGGYMISSFFDIFIEVSTDGGIGWEPASQPVRMEVKVDPALVAAAPAPRPVLPMPNGQYVSPEMWHQYYANGVVIKDLKHKLFTGWDVPPLFGVTNTHTFSSQLDFQLSQDGGLTFIPARVTNATMTVKISNVRGFMGRSTYETEVTALDISGGDLPSGLMIRESPTKRTEGGTSSLGGGGGGGAGGGAAISSFFDIFTEVSTDGGSSWNQPTNGPARMELERIAPVHLYTNNNKLLPVLTGEYISPQKWHALFASGVVITNVIHRQFTAAITPPSPGGSLSHSFGSQVEMDVSTDGGNSFTHATGSANVSVGIATKLETDPDGVTEYYDTEMTDLTLSAGGVMIRESPTRASHGRTTTSAYGADNDCDSFFDIFIEVSTDGGQSWQSPTNGPVTVTLKPGGPQPTSYTVTIDKCCTLIANQLDKPGGNYLANIMPSLPCDARFMKFDNASQTWLTTTYTTTGGWANATITLNPGEGAFLCSCCSSNFTVTFSGYPHVPVLPVNIPAGQTYLLSRQTNGVGTYENIVGTSPPPGAMVYRWVNCDWLQYYFDELDLVWYPADPIAAVGEAMMISPSGATVPTIPTVPCPGAVLNITCPTNMTVMTTNPAGAVVNYTVLVSGTCPPFTTNCMPPSGSTFPIGVTAVNCIANDSCGNSTNCSFTVTVVPQPLSVTCPSNITVRATSPAGAVVTYVMTTSGGCPPITVVGNPPSGSTFPIGVTIVNCTATDACGQQANCSFKITVLRQLQKRFYQQKLLPPTNGMFVAPTPVPVPFPGGILISNIAHGLFSTGFVPPLTPGGSLIKSFTSQVQVDVSFNYGATWQSCVISNVPVTVGITNFGPDSGDTLYGTELTALNVSGGTLPSGVIIRESPTLPSRGETRIAGEVGGYQIDSFFDIYLEVSTDYGVTFVPANSVCTVQVKPDPALIAAAPAPRTVLPMPNGQYISPTAWHQLYASGIVIKDIRHKLFTGWMEPPVFGGSQTHTFDSQLDFQLSTDGGSSFYAARAPATMTVSIQNNRGFQGRTTYETTVTQLDVAGGDLPVNVRLRESPTKASMGGTSSLAGGGGGGAGGGAAISSFFDIFTEVSTDGGSSWGAATNGPAHMELERIAKVHTYTNNLLPVLTGEYVSPQQWHAYYAVGIVITNVVHRSFTAAITPPLPGYSTSHTFGSTLEFDVSYDDGLTYEHATAPATVGVQITCRLGHDEVTEYYDTEMTQLSVSGGGLPGGIMIRESPTRQSLGRTTSSTAGGSGGYQTDSFFDVYTEISVDGGMSWYPSVAGPATVTLQPRRPQTALNITCPTNMTVQATNVGGNVVYYTVLVSGGCPPYTTNCVPPSGSVFPIGTTLVNCTATDTCGGQTNCSFTITVRPPPVLNITCPTNMTVQATNPAGAVVNYTVLVSGGCPPYWTNCAPPSGSTFPIGTTTVTCTAGDTCGQQTNCSFTITVVPKPLSITCPSNITVRATSPAGAVVNYVVTASGGCPPITVIGNPPSGSTFPIGVTIVNCTATDACGQQVNCSFKVTVLRQLNKRFYALNLLPPTNSVFVAPTPGPVPFPGGILVSNIAHGVFSTGFQPPETIGGSLVKSFTSQVQVDVSFDYGATWQSAIVSNVPVTVGITNNGPDSGDTLYGTELTQLDISGGTLPSLVRLRESPTRPSLGETRIEGTLGGYQIDSFFDVYLEISTDGGLSWWPALSACTVEVKPDPGLVAAAPLPRPVLPVPNGQYVGPRQAYGNGVIVREIRHKLFTAWDDPPPFGITHSHTFDSKLDFELSTDGGVTFAEVRAPATLTVTINNVRGFQGRSTYDTEMTQLDVAGGDLSPMLRIRESPTKASKGGTSSLAGGGGGGAGGGAAISSFFDVYTEVSTDGGLSYWPATNGPCHMELRRIATAHAYTNNVLPPFLSDYASQQHAKYGTAYVITNVFHRGFLDHFTPPPLGGSNTHSFYSTVEFDLSQDGGRTFTHASAPAAVTVSITARTESDGVTVYYDTEMTQLDASGGGLPAGMHLRESPTKQSLGRTTSTGGGGGGGGGAYHIDSFFDVYTEISTDSGMVWQPTTSGPAEVTLQPEASIVAPVTITGIVPATVGVGFDITYTGGSGSQFILLTAPTVTTPMSSWVPIATNPTTPGSFTVSPTTDTFYRIESR